MDCALFVGTKTKPCSNTTYKNWNVIRKDGSVLNKNVRGGCLAQIHPAFKVKKMNCPAINNPWNEVPTTFCDPV